jgi:type I restriction enzyme, S subunit
VKLTPIRSLVKKTKQLDPKMLGRDNIVYVDISSVDKETKRITHPQRICVKEAPSRARKQIQVNDVLVATVRPNLNGVALVPLEYDSEIASTGFCVLRAKNDVLNPSYLFYFTRTLTFVSHLTRLSIGAGYPAVTDDNIFDTEIPLPPLNEQKRIATILAKADRLRRLRRYTRELSDGYLQSVFLEMFGDPVSNPRGWEPITLGDVLVSVKDGPHVSPKYADNGIPFLSTRNVRKGEVVWEDLKYISREDAEGIWSNPASKPEWGDILYTKGGTTGLAKTIDFNREIAVWVHIAVLKLQKDKVVPVWLENMLNSDYCYKQSQELTFGIVNHDLGLKRMPRIKIYLPPLPLQQKFTQIVQKHKRLRAQQREAERQAEHLFQSLLHRAFREELGAILHRS